MENAITDKQTVGVILLKMGYINQSNDDEPNSNVWLKRARNSKSKDIEQRVRVRQEGKCLWIEVRQILPGYLACPDVVFPDGQSTNTHTLSTEARLQDFFSGIEWNCELVLL